MIPVGVGVKLVIRHLLHSRDLIPIYTYKQGAFNLQPRPCSRSILVVLNL